LAVNDLLRSTTLVQVCGQLTINTGLWRIEAQTNPDFAGVQAVCQALADHIHDAWSNELAAFMADTTILDSVQVQKIHPAPAFVPMDDTEAPTAGTDVQEALPPQDALVVSFLSDFASRAAQGRNYLCGFAEDRQAEGQWSGATIVAAAAWAAEHVGNVVLAGVGTVVRVIGRPPYGGVEYEVTAARPDTIVRSQRRRQLGVGM